jgi:hypothetical protein
MPEILNGTFRSNKKEVVIDLLESIAFEEIALSHESKIPMVWVKKD